MSMYSPIANRDYKSAIANLQNCKQPHVIRLSTQTFKICWWIFGDSSKASRQTDLIFDNV